MPNPRDLDPVVIAQELLAWCQDDGRWDPRAAKDWQSLLDDVDAAWSRLGPRLTQVCNVGTRLAVLREVRDSGTSLVTSRQAVEDAAHVLETAFDGPAALSAAVDDLFEAASATQIRAHRAGATGEKLLRADSSFWNKKLIARLEKAGWAYSISVRLQFWVKDAVAAIPESAWQTLEDYSLDEEAQIAETIVDGKRLIVRRTRLIGQQAELWPDWRCFPFLTNRTEALEIVEAEHRQHAVVELTIRDLKDQALAHFPSGRFNANSAWTVIACIAHNLLRWTSVIGLSGETVRVARTMRRRLLQTPGRLTRTGRQWTLHLPIRWPWQHDFTSALARIRALPELT